MRRFARSAWCHEQVRSAGVLDNRPMHQHAIALRQLIRDATQNRQRFQIRIRPMVAFGRNRSLGINGFLGHRYNQIRSRNIVALSQIVFAQASNTLMKSLDINHQASKTNPKTRFLEPVTVIIRKLLHSLVVTRPDAAFARRLVRGAYPAITRIARTRVIGPTIAARSITAAGAFRRRLIVARIGSTAIAAGNGAKVHHIVSRPIVRAATGSGACCRGA